MATSYSQNENSQVVFSFHLSWDSELPVLPKSRLEFPTNYMHAKIEYIIQFDKVKDKRFLGFRKEGLSYLINMIP